MSLVTHDTITISVRDIYEAIAKNGFDHVRESWLGIDWRTGKIGACVLGQAALNLGIVPFSPDFSEREVDEVGYALDNYFRKRLNSLGVAIPKWQYDAGQQPIGDVIIYWNDLIDYNDDDESEGYHLETYESVSKMAYEVLSPHFDEEIMLNTLIWENS